MINPNHRLKIAIFTHNFPDSEKDRQNAGIFVYDLARQIKKSCDVFILSAGDTNEQKLVGGLEVRFFRWSNHKTLGHLRIWNPVDVIYLINFFISGAKALEKFKTDHSDIDLVISMWAFPSGYFANRLKSKYKIPYAVWCLGSDIYVYARIPILKFLIRKILKGADFLFADGVDLSEQVQKLANKKCIFLPSASEMPSNVKVGAYSQKKQEVIRLVFVGRMEKVKGPDILLKALILLNGRINKFNIQFIGDGSLLQELKHEAKLKNIADKITFHGNINDKNRIFEIIKESDWLIIPSRSDSIPLVFSEGMKAGTPIIASSLPDLTFLIKKYNIGYTFNVTDEVSLFKVIETLPFQEKEREVFSGNTKKAAQFFSLDESARTLIRIIKSKLN